MADIFDEVASQGGGDIFDQVAPKEEPGVLSRLVSGVKEMLPNPVAIAQEYANRPSQWRAVSEVLGTKRGSAEEKAALEKHKDAPLSNPMAPVVPMGAEPAAAATEKAMRGDVAGAAGNLIGGYAVPAVAARYGPAALRAGANSAAKGLEKSAQKNYRSVLLPGKKQVVKAEQTAAELAKQKPVALTREGLAKRMDAQKREYGPKTATVYNDKPPVDPAPVLDAIERLRKDKVTVKGTDVVVSEPLNNAIDAIKQKIVEMQEANGRIPAAALDDFKDKLFKGSVDATGNLRQVAPQTAKAVEQGVAGAIKGNLDELFPDAEVVNRRYSTAKTAGRFLEDARQAEIAAQGSIIKGSSQGFGALTQRMLPRPIRTIPQKIAGVFDSVAWNTASGATKQAISEALDRGDWAKVERFMFGEPKPPAPKPSPTTPRPIAELPADAGPVPKGVKSAAESAQVFAQDPIPNWPVVKSARESAAVFEQSPAPGMFQRPRPIEIPSRPIEQLGLDEVQARLRDIAINPHAGTASEFKALLTRQDQLRRIAAQQAEKARISQAIKSGDSVLNDLLQRPRPIESIQ